MSTRRFQKEMTDYEAIEQDLIDSVDGLNGNIIKTRDWIHTMMEGGHLNENFHELIEHLEGEVEMNWGKIERFHQEEDMAQKLDLIHRMSLQEAIRCVQGKSEKENTPGWNYLVKRLEFYEKLIKEKIESNGLFRHDPINGIRVGLKRDILYATMLGSPELASVKMATKRVNAQSGEKTKKVKSIVELFGSYSGVDVRSIGQYADLVKLYKKCKKEVNKKYANQELSEEIVEHRAVALTARRLEDAYKWAKGVINTDNSPSNPSFKEAVEVAQLGDLRVKAQLRGMRSKIHQTDLHNIGRFIGVSGDNPYREKTRKLEKALDEIKEKGEEDEEVKNLRQELSHVTEKYHRKASLAEKAIWLHFEMKRSELGEEKGQEPSVDWINEAPIGLINWTYNAMHKGVSAESAFAYAKAVYMFPEETPSRGLMEKVKPCGRTEMYNIKSLTEFHSGKGIKATAEELCILALYDLDTYKNLIEKGYSKESILKHPWLLDGKVLEIQQLFPFGARRNQQEAWCSQHSFHFPEDWNPKRVGAIILSRLDAGVDATIHDASYWLKEFEVPNEKNGVTYKDHQKEIELIYAITEVPDSLKTKIPSNPNKYSDLFSSEATELIYKTVLELMKEGEVNFDEIENRVNLALEVYESNPNRSRSLKVPLPQLKNEVEKSLKELLKMIQAKGTRKNFSSLVGELRDMGIKRKGFIDTAQAWVLNNASTPRELLTFAWANRELALADGCDDNPRAIKQWADLNSLRKAYEGMAQGGRLPYNFEKDDITTYKDWLNELVRCYDGETAIKTLAELKEEFDPHCEIMPMKINLGNGWTGEIFKKNDPRGLTIGHDTGCCMTLGGASESCIHAGYSKSAYGFFALYRDEKLVAQSFLYANQDEFPDVIVADNIEANEGRDMDQVLDKYKTFFSRYLRTQLRRGESKGFTSVHIGEGYTSVSLDGLNKVGSVNMPDENIYTDAVKQRLLVNLSPSTIEKLKAFKVDRFKPSDWDKVKRDIMEIEKEAFGDQGFSEEYLEAGFIHPKNIVIVMHNGDEIIGYSIASPHREQTLYVSSTALRKQFQKQGLVSDIMQLMDNIAYQEGYKFYQRDAAVENEYAAKLMRNYRIIESSEPHASPHGMQMRLKMEIPDHSLPNSMHQTVVETNPLDDEKISFFKLSEANLYLASRLEQKIYPEALRVGIESLAENLEFEDELHENASFIIRKNSDQKTEIGYAIAYLAESEIKNDEVLYINDVAIYPNYQGKGYGKEVFKRLIGFAENRGSLPIEFHARENTSYPAILHSLDFLEKLGYKMTHEELIEDYFEEAEEGDRNVYLIRLEKIKDMKKIA